MKLLYLTVLLAVLASCNKTPQLKLTVKYPGVKNGVAILKQANEIVLSESFKGGELNISRQLATPGYYSLSIFDNDKPLQPKKTFDLYLETKEYQIEVSPSNLPDYPKITTTSAIQNQLSDYYSFAGQRAKVLDYKIDSLVTYLQSQKAAALPKKERSIIYADTRVIQKKRRELDLEILKTYTEKHPQNTIGAHIMAQQYYFENPKAYNSIFQKFTQDVKDSDDGLKINNKLSTLLGVMTNAKSPDIIGNKPDGQPFNKSAIKNEVTLVEFWLSSHMVSALDHQKMVNGIIISDYDRKRFGILSVSVDTIAAQWNKVIKQDLLTWPQVSDLKGNSSPNVKNWNITKLPTYFLVDKNWRIIKSDIDLMDIDEAVHSYFKKHPNL
ncbi:peroxiredoxin family protein [Mucilaginibacter sp.]|jgi:hypothetical protein|uniref:peroxiredoxin family protein n=1 Tax=Mucilaginibacter sp. TaxID=1882438 RepID=UPI00356B273A